MAKPDPALLDPARYPFRCEITTRFGDLDTNRHINNVALAGLCEDARARFHGASGYQVALGGGKDGAGSMIVSFAIEYLGQAFYPEPIEVNVAAERLGGTSCSLVQLLRQGTRVVAFTRSTTVFVRDGKPCQLPDGLRASIEPWMLRP
jgi:acyl-CoA thioester hydrolase